MDGKAIAIALAVALTYYAGVGVVRGVKAAAHETKCGIARVVGHACKPKAKGLSQPPLETGVIGGLNDDE